MATEDFRRGTGGDPLSPPLEQGGAQTVNDITEPAPDDGVLDDVDLGDEELLDEEAVDEEDEDEMDLFTDPEFDESDDAPLPNYRPEGADQFLVEPGRGLTGAGSLSFERPRLPLSLIRNLPILGAAASNPNSPPHIRMLFHYIVDNINEDDI